MNNLAKKGFQFLCIILFEVTWVIWKINSNIIVTTFDLMDFENIYVYL